MSRMEHSFLAQSVSMILNSSFDNVGCGTASISYRCSKRYHRCLFWVNGIVTKRNSPHKCLRPLVRGGFLHLIDRDYVDGRLLSREL